VLGVADAGIEDDFFAVGGDSMLATMFVVHATETLGAHVSLVDFMEAPTIAGLSAAIARRAPLAPHDGTGRLVAIQPEGLACPLFCVPPLDGTLVGFGLLSMHVGRDQPMWGFAPLRARAGGEPHTIEEIAGAYVETMRAMCGDGPYLLLGDCFGGFVAYEMACQLGRRGDDVALLAMVDAPFRRGWRRNRSFAGAVAARARHALARGRFQLSTIGRLRGNERTAYVRDRGAALASSIRGHVLGLAYRAARIARVTPPLAARDPRQANAWAEARYEPGSFDGRVAFFKTSAPTAGFYPSRLLGWEGLFLGRTRVVELPGEHRLRYQPETLKALARGLREELADEQIGAGSRTGPPAGRIASTPPVSIGLPVYNGERFVSATIESILAQSFTDFELIISDNASTDRTEEICRAFALRDPRVRYFRSDTNLGAAANFNRVLARARGRYFKWAAHDDLLAPTWLARAVEVLDKDASAVLCQSDVTIIDENGIGIGRDDLSLHHVNGGRASARFGDLVLVDHRCHGIFGLIRSDVLRRTRGFARYVGADRVLLAELGLMGRFRTIDEPLFFERDHPARSVNALPLHRRAAFFDPGAGSRRIFPHWRLYRECFGVVRRAPLGTAERWACYGHLLRWPWANMNWARLVSDLLIAVNPDLDRRLTAMGRRLARPQ
jgi:glycosyltransferase involved in cell wall biosynthesis/thioesterase domain-containing protein